jgi:hypothetical protein
MIAFQEDEKRRTPFQLRCPLFIAVGERCRNLRIQLRYVPVKRGLDLGEFLRRFHRYVVDLQYVLGDGGISHRSLHSCQEHHQTEAHEHDQPAGFDRRTSLRLLSIGGSF